MDAHDTMPRDATFPAPDAHTSPRGDIQRLGTLAGSIVSAIGAAVLYGWWRDLELLTRIVLTWPPMVANTAFMLLLAGASLVMLNRAPRGHMLRYAGIAAAAIVELIAMLTLTEYLFDWDAGIDQWLVQTQASLTRIPGRPSPQTALTLALLSAALLMLDRDPVRMPRWSEMLCFVALSIPMVALLGYVYGASQLYGLPDLLPYTGMAVHTALSLLLLGAGILATRPAVGFMSILTSEYAAGGTTRRVFVTFLIFPIQAIVTSTGVHLGWYPNAVATAGIVFFGLLDGFLLLLLTGGYVYRKEVALRQALHLSARLRNELEAVTGAAAVVSDAVADLPASSLVKVLHTVAREAQALTAAHHVALGIGTDPEKPFDPWIAIGMGADDAFEGDPAPRPVGLLEAVARDGQVIRIPDVHAHGDFAGFAAGHMKVGPLLAVPIRYRRRAVGNLFLARKPGAPPFTEQDQWRVQMLAAKAGAAIEIATLYTSEAEERLWLQTTIDQMPEPVIVLDRKGGFDLRNRAAQALSVETDRVDARGQPLSLDISYASGERVPPDELPIQRALLRGETVLGVELVIITANGRRLPVIASATPVRVDGQITGAVGVFQDISQLKELERLREEWTSVVAHDLRQPVNTIAFASEGLAALCAADAKERLLVERIRRAVKSLERMVGDLLDASRLESRRLAIEREPLDLRSVLEEVWMTVPELRDRHVRLDIPASMPQVSADRGRLEQILRNLLSNAGKYGSAGTEVEISATPRDGMIEITIKNRGPGIAPEDLPRLFQRFGRSKSSREAGASGIGLGLYITKGLVEAHGGRIWLESTPGDTTCFYLTLPASEVDTHPPHARKPSLGAGLPPFLRTH